jgi:SAM-dependent methyltransferase
MSSDDRVPGFDQEEADRIAAGVARLVPPTLAPFLDARFTRSHALYDEFVYRLTLRVLNEAGLAEIREWSSAEEIVARAGLDAGCARIPVSWMLAHLAGRGWLAREGGASPRFRCERTLPDLDPADILAEQQRHDPACLPSYALAQAAALDYPAFLRGGPSGEDILLAPRRLGLWTGYFSNENILYAINNRVGAVALDEWMPRGGAGAVLELGGGLGSGAAAALERLTVSRRLGEIRGYRFTELVQAFLRRGERLLKERYPNAPLTFAPLDMNRPLEEQGVPPGSVSAVYAVNTLHVARDLALTLGEVYRALEPGGAIILSEGIRPWAGRTVYPEFVFNLLETFRSPRLHPGYRPNGGFLTPDQWTSALEAAGFVDVRVLPDIARVREVHSTFYVAAIGADRPS